MKINFTKKQYKVLINALQIAGTVYGVMSDMVDKKYKKNSNELDDLEDNVLGVAADMGFEGVVDEFQGMKTVDEKYLNKAIDDLNEYEEFSFWDTLPQKLANRDLLDKFGTEKLRTMEQIEYINAEYPIEDEYRKEFEERGLDRIKIVQDKK